MDAFACYPSNMICVLIFQLWNLCFQQSGFEGFVRDKYTALPETRERILATEVTASWKYDFPILLLFSMRAYRDVGISFRIFGYCFFFFIVL